MTIILKENSEDIRKKITEAGIKVCVCTKFVDSCWLDYHPGITEEVHGVGFYGEEIGTASQEESCARFLSECEDPYFSKDVDDFIATIKNNV